MLSDQYRPAGPTLLTNRGGRSRAIDQSQIGHLFCWHAYPLSFLYNNRRCRMFTSATRLSCYAILACCCFLTPSPFLFLPPFFHFLFPFFVRIVPIPLEPGGGTQHPLCPCPSRSFSHSLFALCYVALLYREQMLGPQCNAYPPLHRCCRPSPLETWPNDPSPLRCRRCTCTTDSTQTCFLLFPTCSFMWQCSYRGTFAPSLSLLRCWSHIFLFEFPFSLPESPPLVLPSFIE